MEYFSVRIYHTHCHKIQRHARSHLLIQSRQKCRTPWKAPPLLQILDANRHQKPWHMGGPLCLTALEQPHRLSEESPITFLPRRSHLHSCRWIFPGSHSRKIRASHVDAARQLLWRLKALLLCCQQSPKTEAGTPPKSASQSAISQPALTAVNYSVPGDLVRGKVYKDSCLALSRCSIWMCSIHARPRPHSSHFPPAAQGRPPPRALPLPTFSLPSWFPMSINQTWPGRGACLATSCLGEPGQPSCQGTSSCLAGPAPLLCPDSRARRLRAPLVPGFSECFGPHRCNLGKDEVVGASRAVPVFPNVCGGLWLFHGPSAAGCSLPPARLSRSVYSRTEQLKPCWDDMLGFGLFWAGDRRLLGPSGWAYNLWVPRCHSSGAICKPQGCGHGESKTAVSGKKTHLFSFSMNSLFFCFLTQQKAFLFLLQQAVLQVCIAALHRSPQGCTTHEEPHQECCKGLSPPRPPHFGPESMEGTLGPLLRAGAGVGVGGLGLSEASSLGRSLAKP